uniref:Uncharacterized protein n=1 Tax=Plectus sambesii TaxID=2011161 RepID=A0A914VS99_9BILA
MLTALDTFATSPWDPGESLLGISIRKSSDQMSLVLAPGAVFMPPGMPHRCLPSGGLQVLRKEEMGNTDSIKSVEESNGEKPSGSRGRRNTVIQLQKQQKTADFKARGRSQSVAGNSNEKYVDDEDAAFDRKRKGSLPHLTRLRIHKCFKQSRQELGSKIFERACLKRADFRGFVTLIGEERMHEMCEALRTYLQSVVEHIENNIKVAELSTDYGATFVPLTPFGFKADFFALIANCITAECVQLDGTLHHKSDTFLAWSNLTAIMFSSVRDGYYASMRRQRKTSLSSGSRQSSADQPVSAAARRKEAFRERKTMSLDIT